MPNYADAYVNLGTWLVTAGATDKCGSNSMRQLADNPRHAEAHNTLGNLLFAQRDFAQAAEHYAAAVAERSNYDRAWNNLGVCWMNMGNTDRAISYFERPYVKMANTPRQKRISPGPDKYVSKSSPQ